MSAGPFSNWTVGAITAKISETTAELNRLRHSLAVMEGIAADAAGVGVQNVAATATLQSDIAATEALLSTLESAKAAKTALAVAETTLPEAAAETGAVAQLTARLTSLGRWLAPNAARPALVGGAAAGLATLAAAVLVYFGSGALGAMAADSPVEAGPNMAGSREERPVDVGTEVAGSRTGVYVANGYVFIGSREQICARRCASTPGWGLQGTVGDRIGGPSGLALLSPTDYVNRDDAIAWLQDNISETRRQPLVAAPEQGMIAGTWYNVTTAPERRGW